MAPGVQVRPGKVREVIIRASGVGFGYPGRQALRDASFEVPRGEFLGITGSTGSGKTTLAYTLNGLIPHAIRGEMSGSVTVCGLDTRTHGIPELARKVGFVFQDPDSQLFSLSAREEIAFGVKNMGMRGIDARVSRALRMVGLEDYADTEPFRLSQGQKQKLCIASVLAMEPDVIVLDEPASQLDYRSTMHVYGLLRSLNRDGKAIVVIEHNTELLQEFAKDVMVMDSGRIAALGPKGEVLSRCRFLDRLGIKVPGCYRGGRR